MSKKPSEVEYNRGKECDRKAIRKWTGCRWAQIRRRLDEERQWLEQGEKGDGGQQLCGFIYPVSPKSFSDVCCLCRNMRGMQFLILSTQPEPNHPA